MKKVYCIVLILLLGGLLCLSFANLPEADKEISKYYIDNGVQDTGAINLVTAILFDYRGFDTLGEATIIFAAASAVALLVPKKRTLMLYNEFSVIVRQYISFIIPCVTLLGFYLILYGHLSPGGGFSGGVIWATISILWTITFGIEYSEAKLTSKAKTIIEDIGAAGFVLIGIFSLLVGGNFLANGQADFNLGRPGELISSGIIPYLNLLIGLKVGAGLAIIFNSLIKEE